MNIPLKCSSYRGLTWTVNVNEELSAFCDLPFAA